MKKIIYTLIICCLAMISCSKDFLEEKPVNGIYAENLLVNYQGFENMTNSLLYLVRCEFCTQTIPLGGSDFPTALNCNMSTLWMCGQDNAWHNNRTAYYQHQVMPKLIVAMADGQAFQSIFEWLYKTVNVANMIISRAENPDVDWQGGSEDQNIRNKEKIVAHARLVRAWAYRHLVYSFGPVPLSTSEIVGSTVRTDWERNSIAEIYDVMEQDYLYAISKLDWRVEGNNVWGNQAVARHYLGELYLAMGENTKAKNILRPLVEGSDYYLMTSRFGSNKSNPGSAFMDVFATPQYAHGNMEVLWMFTNADKTEVTSGYTSGMYQRNMWFNWYVSLPEVTAMSHPDYDGLTVELFNQVNNNRGVGRCAISKGALDLYDWGGQGAKDLRYNDDAMVWHLYFLGPDGNKVEILDEEGNGLISTEITANMVDDTYPNIRNYHWPSPRKWQWCNPIIARANEAGQFNDVPYLRLSDTYLLYAEALYKLGDSKAVSWINRVRNRANVSNAKESDMSIDFILDERSRELVAEEERQHTLIRLSWENGGDERKADNIYKTRVRKYNEVCGRAGRGCDDDVTPVLFPIPQDFINSNTGRKIEQNPGY